MTTSGQKIEDSLVPADDGLYGTVQRFLYREAGLLDDHRYGEWFAMLDPDIRYRITVPSVVGAESASPRIAILTEGHVALGTRIRQLENPRLTRAENPRTIMRRFVTNIEAFQSGATDRLIAKSHLLVYRGARPGNASTGFFSASRMDTLSFRDGKVQILERTVDLDHPILEGGIVSTLF